jgi:hypothetical protein
MSSGTDRPISAADIAAYGVMAEKLGFHAIYMTDHYYHLHANYPSLGAAAVLSAVTDTIKIGFSAYQAPLRHPIAAAKELAHLDALCSGRLIAGLAAGSYEKEFDAFGLPFKKRGAMLGEYTNCFGRRIMCRLTANSGLLKMSPSRRNRCKIRFRQSGSAHGPLRHAPRAALQNTRTGGRRRGYIRQ